MNGEADKWDVEKIRSFATVNKFNYRGTFVWDLRVDDQGVTIEKLEINHEDWNYWLGNRGFKMPRYEY